MNAGWIQVARRMVPIQDGKIEGAKPERVVYFQAPDDSMRAMRIEKGDLVLVVPQALPVDGAIMLVEYGSASLSAPYSSVRRFQNSAAKWRPGTGCSGYAHQ